VHRNRKAFHLKTGCTACVTYFKNTYRGHLTAVNAGLKSSCMPGRTERAHCRRGRCSVLLRWQPCRVPGDVLSPCPPGTTTLPIMPPSVWPCAVRVSERRTRHTAIDVEDLPPPTVRARDAVRCGVEAEDLVRCARASLGCGRGGNRVALYEGALLHGVRNLCAASILSRVVG